MTSTKQQREPEKMDRIKQNEIIISIKVAPPKLKLHVKLCVHGDFGMRIESNPMETE